MDIVVFAGIKGGTGKTTLAFNVAVEAAKRGQVYAADLDPQKSLKGLLLRRGQEYGVPRDNPMLLNEVGAVEVAAVTLKRARMERDYMIVDTPCSFVEIIEEAITAADCVVLPLLPSPLDIIALEEMVRMVEYLGKAAKTLVVVNRFSGRSSLGDETIDRFKRRMSNAPFKVADRTDYPRAMIGGRTGAEVSPDAHKEITLLWLAIQDILRKGDTYEQAIEPTKPVRHAGGIISRGQPKGGRIKAKIASRAGQGKG